MERAFHVPAGVLAFDDAGIGSWAAFRRSLRTSSAIACRQRPSRVSGARGGGAPSWAMDLLEILSAATKEIRSGSLPAVRAAITILTGGSPEVLVVGRRVGTVEAHPSIATSLRPARKQPGVAGVPRGHATFSNSAASGSGPGGHGRG